MEYDRTVHVFIHLGLLKRRLRQYLQYGHSTLSVVVVLSPHDSGNDDFGFFFVHVS